MYLQVLDDLLDTAVMVVPPSEPVEAPAVKLHSKSRNLLQPCVITAKQLVPEKDPQPPPSPPPHAAVVVRVVQPKTSSSSSSTHHLKQLQPSEAASNILQSTDNFQPAKPLGSVESVVQPHPAAPSYTSQPSTPLPSSSSVPITTLLHHDGDTIFATQTAPSTVSLEDSGVLDTDRVFLEYHLQLCEKRLEKVAQLVKPYVSEKEARKIADYKKTKEEWEEERLLALSNIGAVGAASKKLRTLLLQL